MVVLERPDRLLLLHQLDPSGPAAGYNPVHVFSPTHLRTPSPVPPSPCVDVLGVVVDVADVARLPGCLVALAAHPAVVKGPIHQAQRQS
jgi:hypothetical protein